MATVAVVVLLMLVCFLPTWRALLDRWLTLAETDAHGFLISAISLGLLAYYSRSQSAVPASDGRTLALLAMLGLGSAWLLGYLADVMFVQVSVLPILMYAGICYALGFRASKVYAFPIAFLYFALPVWGLIRPTLQQMTVVVNEWILSSLKIPALIDGALVHLPSGTFHIASGCAGLHFFVVAFALSALYAHLYLYSRRSKLVLVGMAMVLSILMNWIRVAIIIYAGHVTEMQHYLVTVDHYQFGWYLFGAMLIPLLLLGRHLEAREERAGIGPAARSDDAGSADSARLAMQLVTVAAALALFPGVALALDVTARNQQDGDIEMPARLGDWHWLAAPVPNWSPIFPGAEAAVLGEYRTADTDIHLYLNRYSLQSQGNELVGSTSYLFDPEETRPGVVRYELVGAGNDSFEVTITTILHQSGRQQVALSWYWVGDSRFSRGFDVKLHELLARLRGRPGSGIVAVKADCKSDCSAELELLTAFVERHGLDLEAAASRTAEGES